MHIGTRLVGSQSMSVATVIGFIGVSARDLSAGSGKLGCHRVKLAELVWAELV